jgi:hypothetical protein
MPSGASLRSADERSRAEAGEDHASFGQPVPSPWAATSRQAAAQREQHLAMLGHVAVA